MPLGIVNNTEFDAELKNSGVVKSPEVTAKVTIIEKGRGLGNVAVPNSLRKIIGEESAINGRTSGVELAANFGIKPSSVSAYAHGNTSTATYETETTIKPHIIDAKERVSRRARSKLMAALNGITPTKLTETKARDLAAIAKDMAVVIKTMEPETPKGPEVTNNGPTFVFYAPPIRKEEAYDIIDAKDVG